MKNGQEYKLIAIHPNRTIVISSDFTIEEDVTNHKSKIELAPQIWLGYDLRIQNFTNSDNDTQKFKFELTYPTRNLTAKGWYSVTDDVFDTDVSLEWTKKTINPISGDQSSTEYNDEVFEEDPKTMRAGFHWKAHELQGDDIDNQTAIFVIKHPSFERDVTFTGSYYRSTVDVLNLGFMLEYTEDPDHLVKFAAQMRNLTKESSTKSYQLTLNGMHEISELALDFDGTLEFKPKLYELNSKGSYKRSYISLQEMEMNGLLDIEEKKVKFYVR